MAIKVGRWDCEACGYIGNKGPETKCEKCGSPRPKNVKFYLVEESEIVNNQELIREALAGEDWVCSYCHAHNKAGDNKCQSCGSLNRPEEEHSRLQKKLYEMDEVPTNGKTIIPIKENKTIPAKNKLKRGCLFSLVIFIALSVIFAILVTFKTEIDVRVDSKQWEHAIQLEKYDFVVEEDWELPNKAEKIESFDAIHHYNKVSKGFETKTRNVRVQVGTEEYVSGQRDLGNGYFEDVYSTRPVYENQTESYEIEVFEKVPVYQTKYKYRIQKWTKENPAITHGKNDSLCYADISSIQSSYPIRAIDTINTYTVFIIDHRGDLQEEKIDLTSWKEIKPGANIKAIKSTVFGTYLGLKQ
jgi:hypothetical protein